MKQNKKIIRLAGFGMVASGVGITILVVLFAVMTVYLFGGFKGFDLIEEMDLKHYLSELDFVGRAIGLFFWLLPDALGLWFCCVAFVLFRGFRNNGVFTIDAALRLRKIGWLIFLLAPVTTVSETLGGLILTCMNNCRNEIADDVVISVSLEDTDIFALVIGLLIVAVGHIFVEAVRVSEENDAFV